MDQSTPDRPVEMRTSGIPISPCVFRLRMSPNISAGSTEHIYEKSDAATIFCTAMSVHGPQSEA